MGNQGNVGIAKDGVGNGDEQMSAVRLLLVNLSNVWGGG